MYSGFIVVTNSITNTKISIPKERKDYFFPLQPLSMSLLGKKAIFHEIMHGAYIWTSIPYPRNL